MSNGGLETRQPWHAFRSPRWWAGQLLFVGVLVIVTQLHVAGRALGFTAFENQHGDWPEFLICGCGAILVKVVVLEVFRRDGTRLERQRLRNDLIAGRIKRAPLLLRTSVLTTLLIVVMTGLLDLFAGGGHATSLLVAALPIFLLLVAVEVQILLHPGDALIPDPHDELARFLQSKTLQIGYATAILSLAVLTTLTVIIPRSVGLLLPICLVASLLVPAFYYRRLDRKAEVID